MLDHAFTLARGSTNRALNPKEILWQQQQSTVLHPLTGGHTTGQESGRPDRVVLAMPLLTRSDEACGGATTDQQPQRRRQRRHTERRSTMTPQKSGHDRGTSAQAEIVWELSYLLSILLCTTCGRSEEVGYRSECVRMFGELEKIWRTGRKTGNSPGRMWSAGNGSMRFRRLKLHG